MAPEILTETGYSKPVDWWCFGSLIYEMISGLPPFYTKKGRPELFKKILTTTPKFPKHISE